MTWLVKDGQWRGWYLQDDKGCQFQPDQFGKVCCIYGPPIAGASFDLREHAKPIRALSGSFKGRWGGKHSDRRRLLCVEFAAALNESAAEKVKA